MQNDATGHRLGSLSTSWTLVRQAHGDSRDAAAAAQRLLFERYAGAVQRYLVAVVGDVHTADELTQEFGLLLIRRKFQRLDPDRGRFRDYVKTVLRHLAHRHHKKTIRQPRSLPAAIAEQLAGSLSAGDFSQCFDESWRQQLLARVWERLAQVQPAYHAVLRLRADYPEMGSVELAHQLSRSGKNPTSADNVRQTLRRARERFGDLLLHEVVCSLDEPTPAKIEDELRELRLLEYCGEALDRYRKQWKTD
jgi:RNA polymerase sigma-70 factor (ECF subfamily)